MGSLSLGLHIIMEEAVYFLSWGERCIRVIKQRGSSKEERGVQHGAERGQTKTGEESHARYLSVLEEPAANGHHQRSTAEAEH